MNDQIPQQFQQHPMASSFQNDEIDLKELFLVLWAGKLWIIGVTLLFAVGATIFAIQSPNIYESKAVLVVNADPYGFIEDNGYIVGLELVHKANAEFPFISGKSMKEAVGELANSSSSNFNKLSFSIDKRSGQISVSQQGQKAEDTYQNILTFSQYINQAYKQRELVKAAIELTSTKALLEQNQIEKVKNMLAEKYAQQLYKVAILKNANTELLHVIQEPVKATSYIKPKRALIIVLGMLFGGILGVAIVLIRFALRKE
ncbi:Wzz/FepE/Etk N-terminal domain-containing protein [Aliivibrio sp. S4TY2]|uniref:Wzz/FepE/Etk N-terminal domain-containing protein n=1 Tax=unclassified Aliivibrio TaxID=2645654 RepID=UPI0023790556|nr:MULTISPECIES: Wzz/FepE/Etk N-terminal domain-containing protein [unclassified Aliivibrio]MDD9155989.1 Wzz/FepE/Etk N-terminal domain-containing protein [Aliivibrio sp. S4TY2]MDD9159698.1 Wzz/FepE/Etk N-terminal domain-containing protein [Aliivibrio sp. S4TY1]MDD9163698.1 Wzz/FepE/Etk N-terminal domain-containing protein [Aliivibrio sp. S4MY2]MDD9167698.1 Wzz/FepE/Etk N-terminal domain-containing protein [Aliivibrio sp. S4MY4]MDD9185638.1 Wzz/FepE/Etk N-terminal domain-containing protein [Al